MIHIDENSPLAVKLKPCYVLPKYNFTFTWSAQRHQVDIKLHIKNPEAPKVPEGAVWGGSSLPVSVLQELTQCTTVCLFTRAQPVYPKECPFASVPFILPSRLRSVYGSLSQFCLFGFET